MESNVMVQSNGFDGNYGLTIYRLQTNDASHEKYSFVNEQKNFVIYWVQEGSGIHGVSEMQFPFSDNTFFCTSPGQSASLQARTCLTGYVISFDSSFLRQGGDEYGVYDSEFFTLLSQLSVLRLETEIAEEMNDIAKKMIKESNGDNVLKMEFLRRYLKIFLLYTLRQFELQKPACTRPFSGLLKRFIAAVEKEFKIKKMVMEYAETLSISANYLNQVVKQISGNSAGYHIRQRIIAEAKHKAMYSDMSMKEIAYDLGFETPSHFSKFFKSNAGVNFSDYKDLNHRLVNRL